MTYVIPQAVKPLSDIDPKEEKTENTMKEFQPSKALCENEACLFCNMLLSN